MTSCHFSTGSWLVTMVRADAVPVLEDFEQVVPVLGAERGEPPGVVEHEDLGLGERFEQLRIASGGAGAWGASSRSRSTSSGAAAPEKDRNPYRRRSSARCSCRVSDRTA